MLIMATPARVDTLLFSLSMKTMPAELTVSWHSNLLHAECLHNTKKYSFATCSNHNEWLLKSGWLFSLCCVLRESSNFNKIQTKSVCGERSTSAMQASNRGKAFGALYLTGSLGGMFGSLYATNLGKTHVLYNMLNATMLASIAFITYQCWVKNS